MTIMNTKHIKEQLGNGIIDVLKSTSIMTKQETNWESELETLFSKLEEADAPNVLEEVKQFISKTISQEKESSYELGYQEGQRSKIQDWIIDIEEFENPERIKEMLDNYTSQEREKWVGEIKKGIKENKSKWARESVWKEAYRAGWNNASDEIINLLQK